MKNLLTIIVLTGMFSCVTVKHIPESEKFAGVDFTKYTTEGFLFTPEKYLGEYESIGMVSLEFYTEFNLKASTRNREGKVITPSMWMENVVSTEDIMDRFYSNIVDMGADALMNFRLEGVVKNEGIGEGLTKSFSGTRISGFAIKRK